MLLLNALEIKRQVCQTGLTTYRDAQVLLQQFRVVAPEAVHWMKEEEEWELCFSLRFVKE